MIRLGFKVVRCRRNLIVDKGYPQSRLGYGPSYHYENLGFRCVVGGTGSYQVSRGGSWGFDAARCRAAYRSGRDPVIRFYNLGFRCWRNA